MRLDHLLSKELEVRAPLALWVGVLAPRGAPECGVRGCFWVEHQDSVAPCRGGVARGEYGLSWVWSPSGGWCLGGRGKLWVVSPGGGANTLLGPEGSGRRLLSCTFGVCGGGWCVGLLMLGPRAGCHTRFHLIGGGVWWRSGWWWLVVG